MSVKSPLTAVAPTLKALKFPMRLAEVEYHYIVTVLNLNGNNLTHTAAILGISLNTLKRKLREHIPVRT